ncbi:Lipase 3 [Gryllus bimaculatus]|nr:Lipase 3 [Gryllus bimaculatus]
MGTYDLPASIDYVLEKTGQEKIFYIGHSMGTTLFWIMLSRKPDYNSKFRAMFAMGPAAYLGHLPNPLLRALTYAHRPIEFITDLVGYDEVLPSNKLMKWLGQTFCRDGVPSQVVCKNIVFFIAGYDPEELNSTMLPVIASHMPAGTNMKTLEHFGQAVVSNTFQQFDYFLSNSFHYGSQSPPKYNLSKTTVPVSFHFSVGDKLVAPEDVFHTYKEIRNPIGIFQVPKATFNHLDFLWGIHAKELVYDHVMNLMLRY